jgi:hypothetical protein
MVRGCFVLLLLWLVPMSSAEAETIKLLCDNYWVITIDTLAKSVVIRKSVVDQGGQFYTESYKDGFSDKNQQQFVSVTEDEIRFGYRAKDSVATVVIDRWSGIVYYGLFGSAPVRCSVAPTKRQF